MKLNKVPISAIPKNGLFLHRKEVWRSLGKLVATSKSYTAQKVMLADNGYEFATENADFSQVFLVRPYFGAIPKMEADKRYDYAYYSVYQDYINRNRKS